MPRERSTIAHHRQPTSSEVSSIVVEEAPPVYVKYEEDSLPTYHEAVGQASEDIRSNIGTQGSTNVTAPRTHEAPRNKTVSPIVKRNRRICKWVCLISILVVLVIVGGTVGGSVAQQIKTRKPGYRKLKYKLVDHYYGDTFFDNFDFFTDDQDETFRSTLVNETEARRLKIISTLPDGNATLSVVNNQSARIVSRKTYSSGLFVFQISDFPRSCTYVPTLRLSSSASWPAENDIRVVHYQARSSNQVGIKTSGECSMDVNRQTEDRSTIVGTECNNATHPLAGCRNPNVWLHATYPTDITLMMELQPDGVRFWHTWYRDSGIENDRPDPSRWSEPTMDFPATKCDMSKYFRDMHLVADIGVCGDYGWWYTYILEGEWCDRRCYLEANPEYAFQSPIKYNAHSWKWKSWEVYQPIEE